MTVPREFTDRDDVEVEILQALVDRSEEGMTIFELRTHVGVDIDAIENGLAALKSDGLIDVEERSAEGASAVIKPAERVVPDPGEAESESTFDRIRERLPF